MSNFKSVSNTNLYNSIDGLRTIGILGIVVMHILVNSTYSLEGFIFQNIIGGFGSFVGLFFIISGFGMCCGYYKKILNNEINLIDFYKKRFIKTLPFFALLTFLDVIINFPNDSVYEVISNLTLLFGFYPNSNISIIGVGWFLGVLFAFYCLFPFFCVCVSSKRKAWITMGVSLFFNYACRNYFLIDGNVVSCNILLWSPFFSAGALIFLYKDFFGDLKKGFKMILLIIDILLIFGFYLTPSTLGNIDISQWKLLLVFSMLILFAITGEYRFLYNKFSSFISGISLEIYLSHMVFYRVMEKFNLLYLFDNQLVSYLFSCVAIIILTIFFSWIAKMIFAYIKSFISNKLKEKIKSKI